MPRVYNFSAGPATMPEKVLETARHELTDYRGSGTSIMEMSHRGKHFMEVDAEARQRLINLLELGDDFEILFLQGGASTQFMQVPFNFLGEGETADYINTGVWSKKAIKEAQLFGNVHIPFSGEEQDFRSIPKKEKLRFSDNPKYVHFTSNNTIYGTQFYEEPETGGIPLVCDASSDILSRRINIRKYGLIYAGAQKNLGPSGLAIVIIRKDFLETTSRSKIPTILQYKTHVGTMFNTPPTFTVYMVNLVLKWVEEKGGVSYFEQLNNEKARLLYAEIDADDFYRGTAETDSRSRMNVTFRLPDEALEKQFLNGAEAAGLVALKGHRSVGGIRASIYNAMPLAGVQALCDFMADFRSKNG